jgi:hypothetical protein
MPNVKRARGAGGARGGDAPYRKPRAPAVAGDSVASRRSIDWVAPNALGAPGGARGGCARNRNRARLPRSRRRNRRGGRFRAFGRALALLARLAIVVCVFFIVLEVDPVPKPSLRTATCPKTSSLWDASVPKPQVCGTPLSQNLKFVGRLCPKTSSLWDVSRPSCGSSGDLALLAHLAIIVCVFSLC